MAKHLRWLMLVETVVRLVCLAACTLCAARMQQTTKLHIPDLGLIELIMFFKELTYFWQW
jgi:hypothetical protein